MEWAGVLGLGLFGILLWVKASGFVCRVWIWGREMEHIALEIQGRGFGSRV